MTRFFGFDGDERFGGLGVTDGDVGTRIYVGARGSGRSMYIGRAHTVARMSEHIYALPGDNHNPPDSSTIRYLCEASKPADAVKDWQLLWRAAILRSVTTHLLYNYDFGRPLEDSTAAFAFVEDFEPILLLRKGPGGFCPAPAGVYSQLTAIAEAFRRRPDRELASYLRFDLWDKLESRIVEALRGYPVIGVFLDSLDREFRHAPFHWLTCEKGLFYQVLHFSENQLLAERLRIVATIRDLTYTLIREGDSASTYPPRGRIRQLAWSPTAARALLHELIIRLDPSERLRADVDVAASPLEAWLGAESIHNTRVGCDERLEDYLLSHTFLAARDIVALGNDLGDEVRKAKVSGATEVAAATIRQVVEERAFDLARSRLRSAAAELGALARDSISSGTYAELRGSNDDHFEPGAAFQAELADKLEQVVRIIGKVDFDRGAFAQALKEGAPELEAAAALSALWRNGLVGYLAKGERGMSPIFYVAGKRDRSAIPADASPLTFHRCAIDVAELEPPSTVRALVYD